MRGGRLETAILRFQSPPTTTYVLYTSACGGGLVVRNRLPVPSMGPRTMDSDHATRTRV